MTRYKHTDFKVISDFLAFHKYPNGFDKGEKANLRKACKKFTIHEGQLIFRGRGKAGRRVIVDPNERIEIIQHIHAGSTSNVRSKALSGHFGRDNVLEKLRSRYFWYTMTQDVSTYVSQCETCQKNAPQFDKNNSSMHPIPISADVMKQVGIDLCQLPEVDGYKYLIVCVDYFSKWSEAEPLKAKTAQNVADFLYRLICRHGCFSIQINDQGREFVNDVSRELHRMCGVEQRITSAYHPQANGLVERQNRTIKTALVKVLDGHPEEWPYVIDGVLFAHRVSRHSSTKYSPFYLVYNREPVLPIELKFPLAKEGDCNDAFDTPMFDAVFEQLLEIRKAVHMKVTGNIDEAQRRQKLSHDRRHNGKVTFGAGMKVLLKNLRRSDRKGGKFSHAWNGPFTILQVFENGTLRLADTSGKPLHTLHNACNLKKYFEPSNQEQLRRGEDDIIGESSSPSEISGVSDNQEVRFYRPMENSKAETLAQELKLLEIKRRHISQPRQENVLTMPVKLHHVLGDGNCFFRAISYALTGSEANHKCLRNLIVNRMGMPPLNVQLENYLNKSIESYLDESNMMKDSVWATDAEILATASVLGTDIVIYAKHGLQKEWLRYCASLSITNETSDAIYLTNLDNHFNVVLDIA